MESKVETELPTRERLSITLPKDVLEWIDKEVKEGVYYNSSHAIEACVRQKMKEKKD